MRSSFSMFLLYHAYVYLEFLILACTIYILAPGLPLAKSIIEGQEGLISVQSVLHEGTTFSVSFLTKS